MQHPLIEIGQTTPVHHYIEARSRFLQQRSILLNILSGLLGDPSDHFFDLLVIHRLQAKKLVIIFLQWPTVPWRRNRVSDEVCHDLKTEFASFHCSHGVLIRLIHILALCLPTGCTQSISCQVCDLFLALLNAIYVANPVLCLLWKKDCIGNGLADL